MLSETSRVRTLAVYAGAIAIPIGVAIAWERFGSPLQNAPGYLSLLLVAVIARFAGFLPAMAATLSFAAVLWFYLLPFTFPGHSLSFLILRLLLFVLTATVIAGISRQTSGEVREAEQMHRSLVDLAPDGIGVSDEQGRVVFANNALARLVGASDAAELIGKKTSEFIHPDYRDTIQKRMADLSAGQQAPFMEVKWITLDGRAIDVETAGVPVRRHGKLLFQGFVRDLSERKKTEATMRALFDAAIDAIVLIDSGGRFISANPAASVLLGYTQQEFLAITVEDLAPPGKKEATSAIWNAAKIGESVRGEFTIKKKDAEIREVEYAMVANMLPGFHSLFMHDITARKEAERSVRQLSGRFLHMQDEERRRIARQLHDTTAQNLAALRLNLARIHRWPTASNSPIRESIDESIDLTEQSIAEIRTLAYLLHPPMIEEAGLLPSLRWYTQGFEERSGIKVTLDFPEELDRLPLELETALFRIVQEALTNIQRHSGSEVARIRIERRSQALQLEIEDEGRGMPPALRSDQGMIRASGVGIAGMRERVSELGGRMQIQSRDEGTMIRATLPISDTQ
jgi:PAS domain S-box-containing protein